MDSVCVVSSEPCFHKLKKYANEVIGALVQNSNLQPIVPTVLEFQQRIPFPMFVISSIAHFSLYYRGPKTTEYTANTNNAGEQPIPWNIHQDVLSEEERSEWKLWDQEKSANQENYQIRPTCHVIRARIWLKKTFIIGDVAVQDRIAVGTVYRKCPQRNFLVDTIFGKVVKEVFPDVYTRQASKNVPYSYANLIRRA